MKKYIFSQILISFLLINNLNAQVAVGQWRDQLPYNKIISIAETSTRIYAATPNGLLYVSKDDNSLSRLTKVEGLSDVGISTIANNEKLDALVVAYTNSNVDIIKGGQIINLPDIKRKLIVGRKSINSIFCDSIFAYLSCGFGVVVLNVKNEEFKETWFPGNNGVAFNISDIAIYNNNFYLASDSGIFYAPVYSPNLPNYMVWQRDTNSVVANKNFNFIETFANKLIANIPLTGDTNDLTYTFDGLNWQPLVINHNHKKYSITNSYNKLTVSYAANVISYNTDFSVLRFLYTYNANYSDYMNPQFSLYDRDGYLWIGDYSKGLFRNGNTNQWEFSSYLINGPISNDVWKISGNDQTMVAIRGAIKNTWWESSYTQGFFSYYSNDNWEYVSGANNPEIYDLGLIDFITVAVNPSTPEIFWVGSWSSGLVEFKNGRINSILNSKNSILDSVNSETKISGLSFDRNNNLWIANSYSNKGLKVKTPNNQWYSYSLSPYANSTDILYNLFIDSLGYKWIVLPTKNELIVFNDNNTLANTSDDKIKSLNINLNTRISSNAINCIAQDLNGDIWIGTDKGIKVFYTPSNIFSTENPAPQTILIDQDGYVQNLLEFENVTSIVVDGANRKWIGTSKAGLFVMSPDGTVELNHFTENNSPLFSDQIISISIDQKSGEIFIATDKGIISYGGRATMGVDVIDEEQVHAFPNPVKPGYNGYIAIKGLTTNANIKITDVNGVLVFQTISEGGQAIWDGKDFSGKKVHSGVYLVFSSNEDGTEKVATKILFIQ